MREGKKEGCKEEGGEARRKGRGGVWNCYDWGFGSVSLPRKIPIQNLIDLNTFLILEGVPPRAYSRKGKKGPGFEVRGEWSPGPIL